MPIAKDIIFVWYRNKILDNTGDDNSSFLFPYNIGDERDCVIKMEQELRYLIDTIMTAKHGGSWLSDFSGLGKDAYNELVNRQKADIGILPIMPLKKLSSLSIVIYLI